MNARHFRKRLGVAALVALASAAALGAGEPGEFLAETRGLVRVADKWWLLPRELELKDRLAEVPKRRERILAAEKDLDAAIEQNARAWQENRPKVAALRQSLAKLATSDPKRTALQQQIDALEASAPEPKRVGARSDVRERAVALASERNALLIDAAWIRDALPALKDEYASLAEDQEVQQALRRLGAEQKLGPQRGYQAEFNRLRDYEQLAATRWTPIYWQGNVIRVPALVNEAGVATFSWSDGLPQGLVLTATAAERLGIEIPPDAPRETVAAPGQRRVTARRATVNYLQLGECLLQGVPAHVLPPEAEDLGNWLSRTALGEHAVRMEPERLRLWIDP